MTAFPGSRDGATDGVRVAKRAIHAIADGNESEALAILNGATHAEACWAAAYLLAALRESVADRFRRPGQLQKALHLAARDVEDDLMNQVAVILDQAARHV